MRNAMLVLGLVALIAGALVAGGVIDWRDRTELVRVGDAAISVTEDKPLDRRIGYGLMALGVIGLGLGLAGRRR